MIFKTQNSSFKIILYGRNACTVVRISLINPMNIALKERRMRLVRSVGEGIFYC